MTVTPPASIDETRTREAEPARLGQQGTRRSNMTFPQLLVLQLATLLVSGTGIVFAWMKYGMVNDDPFSVINHPWQPGMLAIHVLTAPILVFALGWILNSHILSKISIISSTKRRLSGLTATALLFPMTASGYLMQTITHEGWHEAMKITHWSTSAVFVLAYIGHLLGKKNGNGNGNGNGRRRRDSEAGSG